MDNHSGHSNKGITHTVLLCVIFLIFTGYPGYSQTSGLGGSGCDSCTEVVLYFRLDRSLLEKEYLDNASSLIKLRQIIGNQATAARIDSIIILATASPEGSPIRNQRLAQERAAAVKSYLMWQYPYLDRLKIRTHSIGEDWTGLKRLVRNDSLVPYRDEVLNVIDMDINSWDKEDRIKKIGNGISYSYLSRHLLPYLRSGIAGISFYFHPDEEPLPYLVETEDLLIEEPIIDIAPVHYPEPISPAFRYARPIAFKTNLLFDLATLLNAEVELPLSPRFSIAGELMFPWWLWEKKQHSLEILTGSLEGRYWFRPIYGKQDVSLNSHNPLTGWFAGLYTSMGKYDLEWDKKGYQGEIFLSVGASLGYVLPLKRNLNLEFSLSAGYLQTDYWKYQAKQDSEGAWHLIKQQPGTFRWIGPTKVKVSLVWYPHFKFKEKGGSRR